MPPLDESVLNAFCEELIERRTQITLLLADKRIAEIADEAHKLAGSAAYCEAPLLESLARDLLATTENWDSREFTEQHDMKNDRHAAVILASRRLEAAIAAFLAHRASGREPKDTSI